MFGSNSEICKFQSTRLCHATWLHSVAWCHLLSWVDTACAPEVNKGTHSCCSHLLGHIGPYVLDLIFVFHFVVRFCLEHLQVLQGKFALSLSVEGCFFCLNYSPFLRVCLSHFTIKVYASVNSPHHVGFGEGLFLTAFCCVRARQLCSVEFFSVDIDRIVLHQPQNHRSVCSIGEIWVGSFLTGPVTSL